VEVMKASTGGEGVRLEGCTVEGDALAFAAGELGGAVV